MTGETDREAGRRLSDVGVALRLRRLWTDDVGPGLEERDHDLGTCWRDTALVRRGLILDLLTPVDFGTGDPFEGVRAELTGSLAEVTGNRVRQVAWRFAEPGKRTVRRSRTEPSDVFHAGDPVGREPLEAAAAGIGKRIAGSAAVRAALARLHVAGVSRYRICLVTATQEGRELLATTPAAGGVLFDAVRRLQRNPEPLYTVTVDPVLAARSPRVL